MPLSSRFNSLWPIIIQYFLNILYIFNYHLFFYYIMLYNLAKNISEHKYIPSLLLVQKQVNDIFSIPKMIYPTIYNYFLTCYSYKEAFINSIKCWHTYHRYLSINPNWGLLNYSSNCYSYMYHRCI